MNNKQIGNAFLGIALLHVLLGVVVAFPAWKTISSLWNWANPGVWEIGRHGFLASVQSNAGKAWFFWFVCAGLLLAVLGQVIRLLEKPLPRMFWVQFVFISLCGVVSLPAGGFWLLLLFSMMGLFSRNTTQKLSL